MKLVKTVEVNQEDVIKILRGIPEDDLVKLWNDYIQSTPLEDLRRHEVILPIDHPNKIIENRLLKPLDILSIVDNNYNLRHKYCCNFGADIYVSFATLHSEDSPFTFWELADYIIKNAEDYMDTYLKYFKLIDDDNNQKKSFSYSAKAINDDTYDVDM